MIKVDSRANDAQKAEARNNIEEITSYIEKLKAKVERFPTNNS